MVYQSSKGPVLGYSFAILLLLESFGIASAQDMGQKLYVPEGCECIELFEKRLLPENVNYIIRPVSNGLPMVVIDKTAFPLTSLVEGWIALPIEGSYSDIHWLGTQCFHSNEGSIYFNEQSGIEHQIVSSNGTISGFSLSKDGIYFSEKDCLFFLSFEKRDITCVYQADKKIGPLTTDDNCCFFSAGNDIFGLQGQTIIRLFTAESTITALAVHPNGTLFFSTETSVNFITPDYAEGEISDSAAHDLVLAGELLFIVFKDASCVMITNSSLFGQKGILTQVQVPAPENRGNHLI